MKDRIMVLLLFSNSILFAQLTKQDSIWLPMNYFMGSWQGTGEKDGSRGEYARMYKQVLNKQFIEVHNTSTYPPTEKKPKGERHEDRGYISYDKGRKTFVLRQFHVEGFVNQYRLENISADGKTIVFLSESIENIPAGWRAKETYHLANDSTFSEIFELAPPNQEFQVYSKAVLKRK